jgi:hypothetical protein
VNRRLIRSPELNAQCSREAYRSMESYSKSGRPAEDHVGWGGKPLLQLVVEAECGLRRGKFAGGHSLRDATERSAGTPKRRWPCETDCEIRRSGDGQRAFRISKPGSKSAPRPCLAHSIGEKYLRIIFSLDREDEHKRVCFQRLTLCALDLGRLTGAAQPFSMTRIYLFNKQRLPRN